MKNLLIVFHSVTDGTRQMAEAAAKGVVCEPEVDTTLMHASQAGATEVLQADGYISRRRKTSRRCPA
jgi:flavodoxin